MDAASKKRKTDDNDVAAFSTDTPTLTPEIAREILEPLSKDQLLEILQTAVVNHRDVLEAVRPIASADPSKRKLFVRGLGWDTTTDKLRTVFSLFGDLDEAIVINDKSTGKSKGYGFVTFRHIDAALLALREPSKRIDGRMTVTQLAAANAAANGVAADVSMRKIFVGNVPFEISSERLLDHFSMFGEIEEGPLGFDNQSGKPRGFAFLVFKTEEGAKASLVDTMKIIDGHQVTCKLAVDGKKGKTGGPNLGVQAPTEEFKPPPGSMPVNSNYGLPGGGFSSYAGFAGGPPAMTHQNPHLNSSIGGQGFGNQGFSSLGNAGGGGGGGGYGGGGGGGGYGGGLGGTTYGGSQYGGSGSGEYGGLNSGGSSLYRLPQSSSGLPSGGYPNSGNYGLSSSAFPSQLHQPPPGPRVPPGGMYQGMPPYF